MIITVNLPEVIVTPEVQGLASWYGPGFHGKKTASGAVYNQNELTAASPSLPFGTKLVITNLDNGKQVFVTVTDRGPYSLEVVDGKVKPLYPLKPHKTRIIDLSKAAMATLGGLHSGVIPIALSFFHQNSNTMENNQSNRNLVIEDTPLRVTSVFKGKYQKEGTVSIEVRQEVQTTYPAMQLNNSLSDNPFKIGDFGNTEGKTYTEKRVAWINPAPEGTTMEKATENLAESPEARIYKLISNRPILTPGDQALIDDPNSELTIEKKAMSQLIVYGDGHAKAGQPVLKDGKPQYSRKELSLEGKADVDHRTSAPGDFYASPEIQALLDGVVLVNEQTIDFD